jgi:hypothetical protein
MTYKLAGTRADIEKAIEHQQAEIDRMREVMSVEESEDDKAERAVALASHQALLNQYQADLDAGRFDH